MSYHAETRPSLLDIAVPFQGIARAVACALFGSALLALAAKIQVPFWPVPMTLQTLALLLIAMSYGSRLAVATVLLYLAEGLAGLPVFAGASTGPAYMMGPTAGFLVGFLVAAFITGRLAELGWDRTPIRAFAAMAIGHVLLSAFGVAWLSVLYGFEKAFAVGFTPFIASMTLKTLLGAALMHAAWSVIRRRSQV